MAKPEEAGLLLPWHYHLVIPGKPDRFTIVANQRILAGMSGSTNQKRAAPWAIRGVSLEARNAAMSASRRESLTLGEWLDRAIRQQVKAERSQTQAVGPTIEETLAKLAESMARHAEATQQQNAAIAARFEALERGKGPDAAQDRGNLFVRLGGLLWRPVAQINARNGQG